MLSVSAREHAWAPKPFPHGESRVIRISMACERTVVEYLVLGVHGGLYPPADNSVYIAAFSFGAAGSSNM